MFFLANNDTHYDADAILIHSIDEGDDHSCSDNLYTTADIATVMFDCDYTTADVAWSCDDDSFRIAEDGGGIVCGMGRQRINM